MSTFNFPSYGDLCVEAAVRHVGRAGSSLRAAVLVLDDGGYRCDALDDLASDAVDLLSDWSGQTRSFDRGGDFPTHIASAALDWRRSTRRTY